jgi:hypothetical protein
MVIPMKKILILHAIFLAIFVTGCSASFPIDTATPGREISDCSRMLETSVPLGVFQVHVDIDTGEFELSPLRKASATDVLEVVDITNFLAMSPCTDCVRIRSVGLNADGRLFVETGIRHPFAPGDMMKPPSGKNRADLHVFNVEGIVASSMDEIEFPGIGETISGVRLLNADGYTKYLDSTLDQILPTEATIHPYITHFDDYSDGNYSPSNIYGFESVTVPGPSGKLVMPMGSDYDFKQYVFDISDGSIDFIFAVGCTYPLAATAIYDRFQPQYRVPQHNKKAASEISYEIIRSDLAAGDTSSSADVRIKIVDISQGVDTGLELDQMLADSSVDKIFIDVPSLIASDIELNGSSSVGGSGHSPADPLLFEATVTNELGAGLGTYPGLIKVLDSYPPSLNQNVLLNQNDGMERVEPGTSPLEGLFDIDEFAAYQYFELTVGEIIEIPIWPVLQGNIGHTGNVGLNGPSQVHDDPSWTGTYPPGWNFYGNPLPIFLSEDTAFVCTTGDGGPLPAYAFNLSDHTLKWTQQFHDDMQNWLNIKCISADGSVVLTVETKYNRMVGLNADDGSFMWEVPGMIKVDSYPTLDLDGNFIVPLEDVGIRSIEPVTGTVNWTSSIGDTYYNHPAVGENGRIYSMLGSMGGGNVVALDPSDGHKIWDSPSVGLLRGNGVTVHPNQTIIVWGGDGMFCFRDDDDHSTTVWSQPYSCPFYASVAVGLGDDIFAIDYDGNLRRIDPTDGTTIISTGGWGDGVTTRMAVGADGLIYTNSRLYMEDKAYMTCFNPDCTVKWQHEAGSWWMDGHYSSPCIGQDGTLYSIYREYGICGWVDS